MYKLGLTLTIIGIFLWPLLLIGIPLIIIGKNEDEYKNGVVVKREIIVKKEETN